jgi:hypothetical protein
MKYCDDDHDCAAQFPCVKTECSFEPHFLKGLSSSYKARGYGATPQQGVCVCFEDKEDDTPCISPEYDPIRAVPPPPEKKCVIPLGKCYNGECVEQPRDEGCPCFGDKAYDECTTNLPEKKKACVNTEQPCECNGDAKQCVPNFLPEDTECSYAYLDLNDCEVGRCNKYGVCEAANVPVGSACIIAGENPPATCPTVGVCEVVTPQSTWSPTPPELTCVDLNCGVDPDACTAVGGTCVDNCGNGQGTNCKDACYAQNGQLGFPFPSGDCLVEDPVIPSPSCCNAAQMGGKLCPPTQVCCKCDGTGNGGSV